MKGLKAYAFALCLVGISFGIFLFGHEMSHIVHAKMNNGHPYQLSFQWSGTTSVLLFNESTNETYVADKTFGKDVFIGGFVLATFQNEEDRRRYVGPANILGFVIGEEDSASLFGALVASSFFCLCLRSYCKKEDLQEYKEDLKFEVYSEIVSRLRGSSSADGGPQGAA